MSIKIQISKKLFLRLSIFLGILAIAMVLDIHFDKGSIELNTVEDHHQKNSDEYVAVYFFGQTSSVATKTPLQKSSHTKFLRQHDKFLQRYHESKNFSDFKMEWKDYSATPLFLTFQHLLFRNYFNISPDDEPLLS